MLTPAQKRGRKWLLFFCLWTIIGVAFASQLYLSRAKLGDPVSWKFALGRSLADWYVFAVLAIPATWLARRFPVEKHRWRRPLLIHLACGAIFSVSWMILRAWVEQWDSPGTRVFPAAFSHALVPTFLFSALVYCVIVSVSHTVEYYLKYQEREVQAAELEKSLTEAKLQALQMQLNPHFLFNTLHAISSPPRKYLYSMTSFLAKSQTMPLVSRATSLQCRQEVGCSDPSQLMLPVPIGERRSCHTLA